MIFNTVQVGLGYDKGIIWHYATHNGLLSGDRQRTDYAQVADRVDKWVTCKCTVYKRDTYSHYPPQRKPFYIMIY